MKVIIINDIIINFNNVSYVIDFYKQSRALNFIFNYGYYNGRFGENACLYFPCSKEEYQKIHKKIIDFLKDKDETILELNIDNMDEK